MSKLSLTRYLYFLEEVKVSLLNSLLKRKSLKECYFWFSEIYYSGFEKQSIQLLFKIYYDFYCIDNFKFLKKIIVNVKRSIKNNDIKPLCDIVNLLFSLKSNPYIFILRTVPNKARKNVNDLKKLLSSHLKKNNCIKAVNYIKILFENNPDECVSFLEKFKNESFINNELYHDKLHLLIVFSVKAYEEENKRHIIKNRKQNLDFTKNLNESCLIAYKTLNEKRIFKPDKDIGCFNIGINENKFDLHDELQYWEYYCKDTPIWKNRFNEHHVSFLDKTIKFDSDCFLEKFSDNFNYEPDEKINLYFKVPRDNTVENWLNSIYSTTFNKLYKSKINY